MAPGKNTTSESGPSSARVCNEAPPSFWDKPDTPNASTAWLSGAGALSGVLILAVCGWWVTPIQESFQELRHEGALAARAPARNRMDPNSAAGEQAFRRVLSAVLPVYRHDRALLDPILENSRRDGIRHGLAQLEAWTNLRRVWVEALRREGLTIHSYYELAREATLTDTEIEPRLRALLEPASER